MILGDFGAFSVLLAAGGGAVAVEAPPKEKTSSVAREAGALAGRAMALGAAAKLAAAGAPVADGAGASLPKLPNPFMVLADSGACFVSLLIRDSATA